MGAIASELADYVVVTSDNPRTEPPEAIIDDILKGMGQETPCAVEPDRRKAIRLALAQAGPGDTVLLAGKGHETEQEIDGVLYHLDEREEVAEYFAQRPQNRADCPPPPEN